MTDVKSTEIVKRMIAADVLAEGETLRVRIFPKSGETSKNSQGKSIPCIITDGKEHMKGFLIGNAATLVEVHDERPLILLVESYVASLANVKDHDALVYISAANIKSRSKTRLRSPTGRTTTAPSQKRIQGGVAPAFLQNFSHVLSDEALAGLHKLAATEAREHLMRVSNFLVQHAAISTIQSSPRVGAHTNHGHLVDYMAALKEFRESQMDRQKASLVSNAGREDTERSTLIVQQHSQALKEALTEEQFLTTEKLRAWHATLCGQGIHKEAGKLRVKSVRVGHVHFRHHQHVKTDLDAICQELRRLELRFLQKQSLLSNSKESQGLAAVTLAAAVLFSVIDVHGFSDGNGRLARIALNWCLRRFGLPFVIHLFATPAQRSEYTEAIVKTRRNLALVGRGHCSESDIVHALEEAGAFAPMVNLILDRLAKTITEFEKLVEEKSRAGAEEAELSAAKRVRQRERAGTCLICFDDNPNIATLCCGKAVHLNCVAQWISSNTSCPNCREQFPALSPRVRARQQESEDETLEDEDETVEDTEETVEMDDDTQVLDALNRNGFTTDAYTIEELRRSGFFDLARQIAEGHNNLYEDGEDTMYEDNTTSVYDEDDTTPSDEGHADETTTSDGATMEDATESETEETSSAQNRPDLPPFCTGHNCHNRAARDCSNSTCGRCCQLYGRYYCQRHNT